MAQNVSGTTLCGKADCAIPLPGLWLASLSNPVHTHTRARTQSGALCSIPELAETSATEEHMPQPVHWRTPRETLLAPGTLSPHATLCYAHTYTWPCATRCQHVFHESSSADCDASSRSKGVSDHVASSAKGRPPRRRYGPSSQVLSTSYRGVTAQLGSLSVSQSEEAVHPDRAKTTVMSGCNSGSVNISTLKRTVSDDGSRGNSREVAALEQHLQGQRVDSLPWRPELLPSLELGRGPRHVAGIPTRPSQGSNNFMTRFVRICILPN
ncbi:hypothetical protein H920_17253 [Fukomys damarensis]|uniref:Uncharacterized protein n=1 Tax=Fukomys damarensis TaxID=885580 RepID=A0A091CQC9_FUKDA|nr:hypothetical protein H920_17253 [Fukomys damarensis]